MVTSASNPPPIRGVHRRRDDRARSGPLALVALVALALVVLLQTLRALFTTAYGAGEDLGFLPAGLVVVLVLAAPLLSPVVTAVVGSSRAVPTTVGVAAALRLAEQLARPVPFWLALLAVATALVAVTVVISAVRAMDEDGDRWVVLGLTLGVALDVGVRATSATWDVVWRDDGVARGMTALVLALLIGGAVLARRLGAEPRDEREGAARLAFLAWPFIGFAVLYTQNPAYLDAVAGLPVAAGVAMASAMALVGVLALVIASAGPAGRIARLAAALLLGACGWLLPSLTGVGALVVVVVAQSTSAITLGAVAGDPLGAGRTGIRRNAVGTGAGTILLGAAILAFTIHTIEPLPFSNRLVTAALGLTTLTALRRERPPRRAAVHRTMLLVPVAGSIAVVGVVAGVGLAVTSPDALDEPRADELGDPRALSVMSFNINQGVTDGQLDLDAIADAVELAEPDVVAVQEVGRGWAVSGMTDQAEWLRRRLGMEYAWAPAADDQFGNLVLSRLPIVETVVLPLGRTTGTQDRSAAFVSVSLGGSERALIINTHLQNGSAAPIHEERARSYRRILEAWDERPRTVFLGDLNTYPFEVPPGWPELAIPLEAGFVTTQDTRRCTVPTSNENCPDWIFTSPDLPPAPVRIVVDRPDHRPIAAVVAIPSGA